MNGMNSVLLRRHDASTRTANGRESTRIVVTFASIRGSGPFSLVGQAVPDAEVDWSAEIPNLCPRHSTLQDVIENGVGEWFVVRHSLTYTTDTFVCFVCLFGGVSTMKDDNPKPFTKGHIIRMLSKTDGQVRLADGRILVVPFSPVIIAALCRSRNPLQITEGTPVVLEMCPSDHDLYRVVDLVES